MSNCPHDQAALLDSLLKRLDEEVSYMHIRITDARDKGMPLGFLENTRRHKQGEVDAFRHFVTEVRGLTQAGHPRDRESDWAALGNPRRRSSDLQPPEATTLADPSGKRQDGHIPPPHGWR